MPNVVITGSSRGLGLCMAREFLQSGCNITVSGRTEESLAVAKNELREFGDKVIYVPCDVRKRDELENLCQVSANRWGRIDIWINNAGQNTPYEFAWETPTEYVDYVFDTNIKGVVLASQIAVKHMLEQGVDRFGIWKDWVPTV